MGAPPPYCLCFLTTVWAVHGNDHPIAFVWGNQTDVTHGEFATLFLFLVVNTCLWVKHLLFLYCTLCLIPSFCVFSKLSYLYPVSPFVVSPFCPSFTGRGRGWGVACWEFNFLLVLKPAHAPTVQSGTNISQHLLTLSKVLISTQSKITTVGFKKIPVAEMGTGIQLYSKDSVQRYTEIDLLALFKTKKRLLTA